MELNLPRVINAAGTLTRLSAGPLAPGVIEAMAAADQISLDMAALQAHASDIIAQASGAEAGLVSSGAAAGLLLSAAASMARLDVARMNSLPETDGPNEIIVARSHRNGYDHALRAAGARLIEVGLPEPAAGAGIRDAEVWEFEAAIGPRTAAILFVANHHAAPDLHELTALGRARQIPVIVDAAAELPPATNLRHFIAAGADLVVFSGGKALGGPAGSGLLCGRADLIMSAALQSLDMDVAFSEWQPPPDFIDKTALRGLPRQGIGRCCKVGKHEVLGLLAALPHFLSESDVTRHTRWLSACKRIADGIGAPKNVVITLLGAESADQIPRVALQFVDTEQADQFRQRLLERGTPIHLARDPFHPKRLIVNPTCLRENELEQLIAALRTGSA